jgi:hypothetical protein
VECVPTNDSRMRPPDKSLGSQALAARMPNPRRYLKRLEHWCHQVCSW